MEVVVEDKQLSLAIGKKGQNVRLAAKLVGWRIDIKSEEEKRRRSRPRWRAWRGPSTSSAASSATASARRPSRSSSTRASHGLAHLLEMTDDELVAIEGVGPKTVGEDPRGRGAGQGWSGTSATPRRRPRGWPRSRRRPSRTPPRPRPRPLRPKPPRPKRQPPSGRGRRRRPEPTPPKRTEPKPPQASDRRPERRGGWDGWGTLGSSRSRGT